MTEADFVFYDDESIWFELDKLGALAPVTGVTAWARRYAGTSRVLTGTEPDRVQFTVTDRAAAGEYPEGWSLRIPPSISTTMDRGVWAVQATLQFGVDDAAKTKVWNFEKRASV